MKDDIFAEHKTYDLDSLILNELDSLDDDHKTEASDNAVMDENHRLEFVIEDNIGEHVEENDNIVDYFDDEIYHPDVMQHDTPPQDNVAMRDEEDIDADSLEGDMGAEDGFGAEDDVYETHMADAIVDENMTDLTPEDAGIAPTGLDDTFLQTSPPTLNEYLEHNADNNTINAAENKVFGSAADINLQVSCEIGSVSITLDELSKLKVGDCLEFMQKTNKVKLRLNNTIVFAEGYLVEVNGMLGVKIVTASSIER